MGESKSFLCYRKENIETNYNMLQEDHEIFDLVSEIEASEGGEDISQYAESCLIGMQPRQRNVVLLVVGYPADGTNFPN
jgi:hypothetical protein